jgi:hypothetical protein
MATATLLKQIYRLPVYERILIAEHTIHSIRTEKNGHTTVADPFSTFQGFKRVNR